MPNIVKNTTILNPLDLIMPHSCRGCGRVGNVLCKHCENYIISQRQNLCPNCKQPTTGKCKNCKDLPPVYSIGPREDLLDLIIHNFKYNSVRALGPKLASLLNKSLPQDLKHASIVPLPTATNHIRSRGLDHTLIIAKHLARLRDYKVEQLLIRDKNTVQVGADKTTRQKQADSAYAINPRIEIDPSKTYILLDDVWTTGASMKSATKKLQQAGAKNVIIALLAVSRI